MSVSKYARVRAKGRLFAAVSLLASLIAIFTFLTGRMTVNDALYAVRDLMRGTRTPVSDAPKAGAITPTLPKSPTSFVTDLVGVLTPAERAQLDQKLKRLESRKLTQAIVYITDRVPSDMVLEDFTLLSMNAWGVGRAGIDDGLGIFIFTEERRVRIEVGSGLENVITDELAATIIRDELVPSFRRQDYGKGLMRAVDKLAVVLATNRASGMDH